MFQERVYIESVRGRWKLYREGGSKHNITRNHRKIKSVKKLTGEKSDTVCGEKYAVQCVGSDRLCSTLMEFLLGSNML